LIKLTIYFIRIILKNVHYTLKIDKEFWGPCDLDYSKRTERLFELLKIKKSNVFSLRKYSVFSKAFRWYGVLVVGFERLEILRILFKSSNCPHENPMKIPWKI